MILGYLNKHPRILNSLSYLNNKFLKKVGFEIALQKEDVNKVKVYELLNFIMREVDNADLSKILNSNDQDFLDET